MLPRTLRPRSCANCRISTCRTCDTSTFSLSLLQNIRPLISARRSNWATCLRVRRSRRSMQGSLAPLRQVSSTARPTQSEGWERRSTRIKRGRTLKLRPLARQPMPTSTRYASSATTYRPFGGTSTRVRHLGGCRRCEGAACHCAAGQRFWVHRIGLGDAPKRRGPSRTGCSARKPTRGTCWQSRSQPRRQPARDARLRRSSGIAPRAPARQPDARCEPTCRNARTRARRLRHAGAF